MTSDKEFALLSFLLNQSSWVTASTISECINLSPRSISNYISEINVKYDDLIFSSNKGYKVNKNKAVEILNTFPEGRIPGNYNERKKYILEKLLLTQQTFTIDSLSHELCISPSTLHNEISRLRSDLADFQLHLRIKNDKLTIIGQDRDKRRLVIELINEELENSSFSLEGIQQLFENADLKEIKKIVVKSLKYRGYFLDEYAMLNYILHIAVFIELKGNHSVANKNSPAPTVNFKEIASPHIHQIIEDIIENLKQVYDQDFPQEEFFEVSLSMMTSAVTNHITKLKLNQLDDLVGEEIEELLFEIVNEVHNTYSINLKEDNFLIRFAFHLKNVIARAKNDISIRNSQFNKIKNDFPLIYVIAVFISNIINKKIHQTLSEDEIAYIALHIGVLMEEQKAYSEKISCVVLAPDIITIGRSVFKRLNTYFSESLLIANFIASADDLPEDGSYELLLSTIDINPIELNPELGTSYLLIDPFLSESSINNIFQKIEEVKQLKIRRKMIEQFKIFFRSDLFFYDYQFNTYTDAIETICDYMLEKNYVENNYKNEIYEHEQVSPSSYGNIAIPHPLNNSAQSSVIAVSINPAPIEWGINNVNIVFMLSLQEEKRDQFKDIFDTITHLMSNKDFFNKILLAKTYDEFIDTLVSFAIG